MPALDQSRWRFVITDMNGSTPAGAGMVLNTSQKTFAYNKNAGKTAQFTTTVDNPVADYILTHDCLMKVYRKTRNTGQWQRLMVGDVIQADENGQGDTALLTVVGADPWWRFQRRLVGLAQDTSGRGLGYSDATLAAPADYATLLADVLQNINSVFFTGINLGSVQPTGSTSYIGPVYAQNAGDMMQQFCNVLGGPDFEIVPQEPTGTMPNTSLGTMNIWASLGQDRPNSVFEYGIGSRNVSAYDRVLSKDGLCNIAYSLPQGFPSAPAAGDGLVFSQDTASQAIIGLYQDLVQSDLISVPLRQQLCTEYVTVRRQSRQQITITPVVDSSLDFGVDYNVGDTVRARAWVNGGYRFNGTVRIYGVNITVDDNDAESPTLTLIPS